MHDSNHKLIFMLWTVVAVLVVGGAIIGVMLVSKTESLQQENNSIKGNDQSLREQLRQAKASPSPSVEPIPTFNNGASTPTPLPTKTPRP